MDKIITLIATLVGAFFGWLLTELSSLLRLQREDRRAAGPVLTDLLEIRRRVIGLDSAMKRFGDELQIPAPALLQLQQYIRAILPEPPRFVEKYEEAIATLARVDPVQAFRLRGQSFLGPFLAQVENLATTDQAGCELWCKVAKPKLLAQVVPNLEGLILDVARAHGWRTWWAARRHLRKPILDQDFEDFVSEIVAEIKKSATKGPAGV